MTHIDSDCPHNEIAKLKEELEDYKTSLPYDTLLQKKEQENQKLRAGIEEMSSKLQKRIDEETRHINHPKNIYQTVIHNCKYNLEVCKNLKAILESMEGEK